jgi:hypothetical protein
MFADRFDFIRKRWQASSFISQCNLYISYIQGFLIATSTNIAHSAPIEIARKTLQQVQQE